MVTIVYWYARESVELAVTDRNRLVTPLTVWLKERII